MDTTLSFLEERKVLLEGKVKGDLELKRKLELSINTHNTLIEVVNENKDRFEQPEDMIVQFEAINERFEAQLEHVKMDMNKSELLIDIITNPDDYTVEKVISALLTTD